MIRENNLTDWMQGLQYGKGLIYLTPIFRLTELTFLRVAGVCTSTNSTGHFEGSEHEEKHKTKHQALKIYYSK